MMNGVDESVRKPEKTFSNEPDPEAHSHSSNQSNQEEENLIKNQNSPNGSSPIKKAETVSSPTGRLSAYAQRREAGWRQKLAQFFRHRVVEYSIILLIIVFSVLVLVEIVLDDGDPEENISTTLRILSYVELGLVCLFLLEVCLKVTALGFSVYFDDKWYLFDAIVIIVSLGLVILDISTDSKTISGLSRIRGALRLFRIFLLFRKANEFSKMASKTFKTSTVDIKTPVERVVEIFRKLQEVTANPKLAKNLDWCISMVLSYKLYDTIVVNEGGENAQREVMNWMKQYGVNAEEANNPNGSSNKVTPEAAPLPLARKATTGLDLASLPNDVMVILEASSESIDFQTFNYSDLTKDYMLVFMFHYILSKNDLYDKLNLPLQKVGDFTKKIQSGYFDNPYHNATHALDVLQTANFYLRTCKFQEMAQLNDIEFCAMYIAAMIHDYEHPGFNNVYQISTRTELAIRYNDKSVLEQHHVSASFLLIIQEKYSIFENLSREHWSKIRERIIAMVLATDMSKHFEDIGKLKTRLSADFDIKDKDKNLLMEMLIHAADISNPTKPFTLCHNWAERIVKEFFNQGDEERKRGLPISFSMDKYTVNIAKSQMGFIDMIVKPLFEILSYPVPLLKVCLENLDNNKKNWSERLPEYEQRMKQLNDEKDKEKD